MKYLFFLLFFFITTSSYAQKEITFDEADSLSKAGTFVIVKLDSNGVIHYQLPVYTVDTIYTVKGIVEERFDTVLVVLQMSDTSDYNVDNLGKVYWDFGYEIRETSPVKDFNHISYLDIDKKELNQTIIVWQSKHF